jgi:hypothetical protein
MRNWGFSSAKKVRAKKEFAKQSHLNVRGGVQRTTGGGKRERGRSIECYGSGAKVDQEAMPS